MAHRARRDRSPAGDPAASEAEHRPRFLSEDEIARLLEACHKSRNPWLGPLVTLALTSDARRGELETLTWEQLDLEADCGLSPNMRLVRTKPGKPRVVPLMADAVAALVALEPKPDRREGRVFWFKGSIRHAFELALSRAGIPRGTGPADRVSFRTSRHTTGSLSGLVSAVRNEPATAHGMAQLGTCAPEVPVTKA